MLSQQSGAPEAGDMAQTNNDNTRRVELLERAAEQLADDIHNKDQMIGVSHNNCSNLNSNWDISNDVQQVITNNLHRIIYNYMFCSIANEQTSTTLLLEM